MTDIRMLALHPNGDIEDVTVDGSGDRAVLDALYRTIGCSLVDVVRLGAFDMWLDDDGLFTAEINPFATYLAVWRFGALRQFFHGTAVLTGPPDENDDTTSLGDTERAVIADLIAGLTDEEET